MSQTRERREPAAPSSSERGRTARIRVGARARRGPVAAVRGALALSLAVPLGCGEAGGAGGGGAAGDPRVTGATIAATSSPSSSATDAGQGGAGVGGGGGTGGDGPGPCTSSPADVLWPDALAATGDQTLGGHGHDDGKGPVIYCPGEPAAGAPFFRLIAAGVEVDFDIQADGSDADDYLRVDFYDDPATFTGLGESGGRVNVYVEVLDASGSPLDVMSAPEILILRTIEGGPTDELPLTSKPPNEFQTNFPMVGGGATYGVSIVGASDRVEKLRLPVNHHVSYVLVFQREE